jgi:hypothetical protein
LPQTNQLETPTRSFGRLEADPIVLVVHAEPLVGLMLEELLREGGIRRIVTATTQDDAEAFIASGAINAAILGISRNSLELFAVACLLAERQIPFAVSGALTALPDIAGLNEVPVLRALADAHELMATLSSFGITPSRSDTV